MRSRVSLCSMTAPGRVKSNRRHASTCVDVRARAGSAANAESSVSSTSRVHVAQVVPARRRLREVHLAAVPRSARDDPAASRRAAGRRIDERSASGRHGRRRRSASLAVRGRVSSAAAQQRAIERQRRARVARLALVPRSLLAANVGSACGSGMPLARDRAAELREGLELSPAALGDLRCRAPARDR